MSMPPTPLQIDYIDPDGNDWNLTDTTFSKGYTCSALGGIEGLTVAFQTIPLLDGSATPSQYLPQPGSINLAIAVGRPASDNEYDYYTLLDKITRAFYTSRNQVPKPGYIQIQRPNGSIRQIAVYTIAGLNNPEVGINNVSVYTLTLQAPDPYWEDLIPQQMAFQGGIASGILPLLPIQFAGSYIGADIVIVNPGNAQAWPIWTIMGPGTPTFKNLTSGRQWSFNTPIPSGNVVQVVTKPGKQMAANTTTSTNIWDQLVLGGNLSNLWSLMSGSNQINVAMAGSTPATSVGLSWVNRWDRA